MTCFALRIPALFVALALVGCAASWGGRGDPPGLSFFGPDAEKLEKGGGDDWSLRYRNPKADFPSYDKMIVYPVTLWTDADRPMDGVSAADRQQLTDNFYKLIRQSMSQHFTIVAEPGPHTLRLRTAITDARASARTLDTISSVVPQLRTATTLGGYATGKPAFTGEAAFAFKLTDSQSGEVIVMGADKRVGAKSISGATDSWSDVNDALRYWADLAAYRACVARRLDTCEPPRVRRGI